MSTPYYRPSGKVPFVAYPAAIRYALGIVPGAWAYAWSTFHAHYIVNFFLAFAFSVYLGYLVWMAALAGRVRNLEWIGRAGRIFSLLGWYCQWAAWLALMDKGATGLGVFARFIELAADPLAMVRGAAAILGQGTFSIGDWRVAGVALFVVWLLELGMHLMLPARMGKEPAGRPYCESAQRWADKVEVPTRFLCVDPAAIVAQLEADPQQVRVALEPLGNEDAEHAARLTKAVLYRCQGSDTYLSLANVVRTRTKHGNVRESEDTVFDYLRLPGIDPDALLRDWAAAAASDPAADGDGATDDGGIAAVPVAPELDAALAHLQAERFDEALAGAVPATGSDQLALRTDANRICALACSRLGRWQEALAYWRALDADEPTAHNALQLATTSVMTGELADGIRLVEEARERNDRSGEMAPVAILTNFVTALTQTGHVREAMPYVDAIRQAYLSVGTTDPTLLYASGMPFFGVFLEKSLPVVRMALDERKAHRWYASMLPRLDENGQAELDEWLGSVFAQAPGQGASG